MNEKSACAVISIHFIHRLIEFFREHDASTFSDETAAALAFWRWMRDKDADL